MLGRYFARFDEAYKRVNINGSYMKEYWGEEAPEPGTGRDMTWEGDKKSVALKGA